MTKTNANSPPPVLATTKSFSSWGAAFQSAAEVKPHDLGSFNPPPEDTTKPKYGAGDVSGISLIAQESLSSNSNRKRKANDHDADTDQEVTTTVVKKAKKEKKEKKSKKESKKDKKSKRKHSPDSDTPGTDTNPELLPHDEEIPSEPAFASATLEGQMVTHEGEPLFVLVDKSKQIVYSMDRSDTGQLIPIGTIISGEIKITGTCTLLRIVLYCIVR